MKQEKYMQGDIVLDSKRKVPVTVLSAHKHYLWVKDGNAEYHLFKYQPIPITEELLMKCGFTKDDNGNYWRTFDDPSTYLEFIISKGDCFPVIGQPPEVSHESEQRVHLNKMNHLHQLQQFLHINFDYELIYKP